jgi:uncharacterized protein
MKDKNKSLPVEIYSHLPDLDPGHCDHDCTCALDLPSVLSAQSASASFDCDCACAWDAPHEPIVQTGHNHYVKSPGMLSMPLAGGWQVNFNPMGPVGITVLNRAMQQVLAAFETPVLPQSGVDRVAGMEPDVTREAIDSLIQVGLLHPVDSALRPSGRCLTLSAWLHVTQACNLNCAYCYVRKRPSTMSVEVGRRAVDRLVETATHHGYTTLKLKYGGGEPTLNFPVIQAVHARVVRRGQQEGLGLEEVVLTNGVGVSDAVLDFIAQAGMRLMVSLDGGAGTHDRIRARRDGRSTYAAVVDTVERALARGLRPNISITLTSLNLDGVQDAVAFALERDLAFNLNFYREGSCAELAGAQGAMRVPSPLVPSPASLTAALLQAFGLVEACPAYSWSLSSVLDRTRLDVSHSYPCSAGRDYLAIDTDGGVSACQMLLEEPWSDLAQEDLLSVLRQRGQGIFQPVDERSTCRACVWRTACSGGCPLMQESVLHDRYCQVYRTLFPELVRLEGARLLACMS